MTELRQGIGLRAYGQSDPVVEYKREGYDMFEQMISAIQEETLRRLFTVRLKTNEEIKRERVAKITGESGASDGTVKRQPVKKTVKIGRNDPCPCGSGLKWKKCTCKEYPPRPEITSLRPMGAAATRALWRVNSRRPAARISEGAIHFRRGGSNQGLPRG